MSNRAVIDSSLNENAVRTAGSGAVMFNGSKISVTAKRRSGWCCWKLCYSENSFHFPGPPPDLFISWTTSSVVYRFSGLLLKIRKGVFFPSFALSLLLSFPCRPSTGWIGAFPADFRCKLLPFVPFQGNTIVSAHCNKTCQCDSWPQRLPIFLNSNIIFWVMGQLFFFFVQF